MSTISALARPSISIDVDIFGPNATPESKMLAAGLKDGSIKIGPSPAAAEPDSPADVRQANQQLVDGVNTVKHTLSQVNYDIAQQRPDIVDDIGFHYGGHKLATEPFQNTYKEDGSIDKSKPYIENNAPQKYDSATSSAWDFTVEDGQFRVYSKWMDRSQFDWASKGETSNDHSMVQAVSKEQMDVIQKSLNSNQELLKGVKDLLAGIQGNQGDSVNAPNLLLKQLIMDSENLNLQEAGRNGRGGQLANNAEKAGAFRRIAHGLDASLQTTVNINTYA